MNSHIFSGVSQYHINLNHENSCFFISEWSKMDNLEKHNRSMTDYLGKDF